MNNLIVLSKQGKALRVKHRLEMIAFVLNEIWYHIFALDKSLIKILGDDKCRRPSAFVAFLNISKINHGPHCRDSNCWVFKQTLPSISILTSIDAFQHCRAVTKTVKNKLPKFYKCLEMKNYTRTIFTEKKEVKTKRWKWKLNKFLCSLVDFLMDHLGWTPTRANCQ